MLRSLIAIIIAVIAGLAIARGVESAAVLALEGTEERSPAYLAALVGGWGVGAFAASTIALLIARRWAPVGWLAAATLLLQAIITLSSAVVPPIVWAGAVVATFAGGFGAVKLLRAGYERPAPPPGLF